MHDSIPCNPDYDPRTAPRLAVERAWLYRPETQWTYSHHPSLAHFKGRYYAIWSNGRRDEDAPGQRVLMATSRDFRNWSEPVPLLDTQRGKHGERVLTAAGWRFNRHWILADDRSPYVRRAEGLHKGGDYGYPYTLIHGGWLHVIVSRSKEAVEVIRVSLASLEPQRRKR